MRHLPLVVVALLGGCSTLSPNISGDFSCRSPNGVCSPTSAIDAGAVASVGVMAQPGGVMSSLPSPRPEGRLATASALGGEPGRSSERVLKVVFPANVDATGVYHEEAVAHAVIERGGWAPRPRNVQAAWGVQAAAARSLDALVATDAASIGSARAPVAGAAVAAIAGESGPGGGVPVAPRDLSRPAPLNLREAVAGLAAPRIEGFDPSAPHAAAVNLARPSVAALEAARRGHRIGREQGRGATGAATRDLNASALAALDGPRPAAVERSSPRDLASELRAELVSLPVEDLSPLDQAAPR